MEDDHGQDLLFQEAGERPEYNIVTMGESRELQRLLAELSSRSMDRAFLDTLAAAGLAGHGLVEQGHGLVEHTVTNALRRNDITSIPEFIEKGEVALAHIADDRAQGHKVYVGDSTIVTLVELRKLQRLLAELKARPSAHVPSHRPPAPTPGSAHAALHALLVDLRAPHPALPRMASERPRAGSAARLSSALIRPVRA
jgi:hypothetical protein